MFQIWIHIICIFFNLFLKFSYLWQHLHLFFTFSYLSLNDSDFLWQYLCSFTKISKSDSFCITVQRNRRCDNHHILLRSSGTNMWYGLWDLGHHEPSDRLTSATKQSLKAPGSGGFSERVSWWKGRYWDMTSSGEIPSLLQSENSSNGGLWGRKASEFKGINDLPPIPKTLQQSHIV